MGDLTESLTPSSTTTPTNTTPNSRSLPVREDCWSEEATSTLVDAWGRRYLDLNRGNLRQKDWQDVADAVNALHAHSKKTHRTDVQCKNRIDTIKKKYKIEKARVVSSNGTITSSWPFFERMDGLIGNNIKPTSNFSPKLSQSQSPPVAVPLTYRKSVSVNNSNINKINNSNSLALTPIPTVTAVALPQKRGYNSEGFYRNYSAVAAAAAAAESEEEEAEEEAEEEENDIENEENSGVKRLAKAIERFGEVYERVEIDANGLDMTKAYMLDTQGAAEAKYKKWEKDPAPFGWDVFNQKTLYNAYKKRTKNIEVDLEEYNKMKEADPEFYRDASSLQYGKAPKISEDKLDRMVKELKDREEKRNSFSRRRRFHEEKDIDSINDRNEHFNKKIERAFGKYTLEIKNNLERGTALPD